MVNRYYRTAQYRRSMFTKLGKDEVLMVSFWSYLPRGGTKIGHGVPFLKKLLLQTGRLQQQTERIAIILKHVERSVMYNCIGFHSEVKFLICFWRLLVVIMSVSDVLRAKSRFVKFVGVEAAGRTPYTFYKPTLGPKYVSNRPYNEFIMLTTFI